MSKGKEETVPPKHTVAAQVAAGGYPAKQIVTHDGAVWRSKVAANLTMPGSSDAKWELLA